MRGEIGEHVESGGETFVGFKDEEHPHFDDFIIIK